MTARYWPDGTGMTVCVCGHPLHHHIAYTPNSTAGCGTVTVDGPASPPDASAHIEHPGRNWSHCDCTEYTKAGS